MNKNNKISVIIPLYNREDLIDQTVMSVVNQTYKNWELIIVDDGSSDRSVEKALNWKTSNKNIFVYSRSVEPKGASTCRNIGLFKASGDYIIFLDSDDLLAYDALENRLALFSRNPDIDFLVTPCLIFKKEITDTNILWNSNESNYLDLDRFLILDVPWGAHCITWKRKAIDKVGAWDINVLSFQDWDLSVRALLNNLIYIKGSIPDCYWRMPSEVRQSIGSNSLSESHLMSHFSLFLKVAKLIREKGMLNDQRKNYLIWLSFWLFDIWVKYNKLTAFRALFELLSILEIRSLRIKLMSYAFLSLNKRTFRLKNLMYNKMALGRHLKLPHAATLRSIKYHKS